MKVNIIEEIQYELLDIHEVSDELSCLLDEAREEDPTDKFLFEDTERRIFLALKFVEWSEQRGNGYIFTKRDLQACPLFKKDRRESKKLLKFLQRIEAVAPSEDTLASDGEKSYEFKLRSTENRF